MIFRQLFDSASGTYSYLLASRRGGEALIIDPVIEKVDRYLQLVHELDLKLVKAIDTHLHADHITGLGALRDRTHCITVMGDRGTCVTEEAFTDKSHCRVNGAHRRNRQIPEFAQAQGPSSRRSTKQSTYLTWHGLLMFRRCGHCANS
jgi:glyoxylase-like metal-dependent hydrolase (beta-lactamase superfamily II)